MMKLEFCYLRVVLGFCYLRESQLLSTTLSPLRPLLPPCENLYSLLCTLYPLLSTLFPLPLTDIRVIRITHHHVKHPIRKKPQSLVVCNHYARDTCVVGSSGLISTWDIRSIKGIRLFRVLEMLGVLGVLGLFGLLT